MNSDIHKGSPPTHHQLDGSPRSIGSNSSSTSSNSSGSNTSGSGIDKYYPASLEIDSHKEITLRGRGGIGTSPNSSVPIPIPTQMQAAVMAHTEVSEYIHIIYVFSVLYIGQYTSLTRRY